MKMVPEPESYKRHSFTVPDVQDGAPIIRCANSGCLVIWWPNTSRPQSDCKGQ